MQQILFPAELPGPGGEREVHRAVDPERAAAGDTQLPVLFAGGGTGGHLYPGLAIARALVTAEPRITPFFVGASRGIERRILPESGFQYTLLDLHPLYRRQFWKNSITLFRSIAVWRDLNEKLCAVRPILALGTGGYAAALPLAWARRNGIPIALHEPDSHPGLATRLFSRYAELILTGFPEAARSLHTKQGARVLDFGAPIEPPGPRRRSASAGATDAASGSGSANHSPGRAGSRADSRAESRSEWMLPEGSFVVLVTGGSQGALPINETVAAWCEEGLPANVALIWVTGSSQFGNYRQYESPLVRVRGYLSPMADAYAAADLAVARAGAMTVAELSAWGIPSILVPLPTAARDHQAYNARSVEASGAAIHLPQNALGASRIDSIVRGLMRDRARLEEMRQAALARAHPDAAARIAETLLEVIRKITADVSDRSV